MKSIFVSSTFKDMHEERDILHKRVIPELNEYAAQYGESVSLCDLRWGVNTEDLDSEEGSRKVLSVCLNEIDRCRPYMIVLLGERYGWIPKPDTLREIETRAEMNLEDMEKSVTALEIEYGVLGNKEQLEHILFYFREFEGTIPEHYGREDVLHERKLYELKDRIRNLTGTRVHTYTVSWDAEKNTLKGLEDFAEQMTEDLKELLEEEWKEYALLTPFERNQRLQWDFARQKSDQFRAREGLINQYLNKLNQGQNFLAISGASGSGKSTLIGRLAVRLQEEGKNVLPIFCGSTMFCNDAMDVIRYIVRYIEDQFSLEHYEEKRAIEEQTFGDKRGHRENRTDIDRWTDRLAEMCALYAEKSDREMVILIDALDQLFPDEIRDGLRFIPTNLSGKVKMVCSFLDSFDTGYCKKWEQEEQLLPLDETDKKAVVDGILYSQRRELSYPVIEKIMTKNGADNSLYLSLAIHRLIMMDRDDYEKMTATGGEMTAITTYQMAVIDRLPENLEDLCMDLVHVASEKLNNNMAELAVRYIAVSRYGLREIDLGGIFANQGIEWNSLDFTLFLRYMKSFFLLRDDGRLDFTHQSIRMGVLKNVVNEKELHRQILDYLKKLGKKDEVRISEIIYHCWRADDQRYFVQYVSTYEEDDDIIKPAAKVTYEIAIQNAGNWLCDLITTGSQYSAGHNFLEFFNWEVYQNFNGSQRNLSICKEIYIEILKLSKKVEKEKNMMINQLDLEFSYDNIGDICLKLGGKENLYKARDMYEKSLNLAKELVERKGTDERNLMVSYNKVGDIYMAIYRQRGGGENLKKSKEMYKMGLYLAKELVKKEDTCINWNDLRIAYLNLGDVYMIMGGEENLNRAKKVYEKSLDMQKKIVKKEKNIKNLRGLSVVYSRLGDTYWEIYLKEGLEENLNIVCDMYEKSNEIFKELVEKEETSISWRDLSISYGKLGDIYGKRCGEKCQSKSYEMYMKSLRISENLAKKEGTLDLYDLLAVSMYNVAINSFTPVRIRKQYLQKMKKISEMLMRETGSLRYLNFIAMADFMLKSMY